METGPVRQIVAIHHVFDAVGMPHAFGGALALAWCTERARGTVDVDVNVFVPVDAPHAVLAALPEGVVSTTSRSRPAAPRRPGACVVGKTPIDLFLNTTEFHEQVAGRARREPFMGEMLPFLACDDLAVFKAFFNRSKDWVDLEEMVKMSSIDAAAVLGTLTLYLGGDDERIARLRELVR